MLYFMTEMRMQYLNLKKYQFQFIYYTAKGRRFGANITNFKILLMCLTGNKYKLSYKAPFYDLFHIFSYQKLILLYQKINFLYQKISL